MYVDVDSVDSSRERSPADQGSPDRFDDLHEGIFDDLSATVIERGCY